MSRLEFLLNALNNGGDIKDFEPQSRCEEILKACCTGEECSVEPKSRIEALLKLLHTKLVDSSALMTSDGYVLMTSNGNIFNIKEN